MKGWFYLLKIQIIGIEPAVWRPFVASAGITLDRLHDVIQVVMGWSDCHLHQFTIGKKRYTEYPQSREDGLSPGRCGWCVRFLCLRTSAARPESRGA
jgi:hypothetical protein